MLRPIISHDPQICDEIFTWANLRQGPATMSLSAPTWDTSHAVRLFKEYAYKYRYCGPGDTTASIPIATIFPGDTPGRRASSLTKVNWQRSDFTGGGDSKMCSIIESMAIFSERSAFASSHETILLCAGLVMAVFLALLAVSAAAQFALLSGPLEELPGLALRDALEQLVWCGA